MLPGLLHTLIRKGLEFPNVVNALRFGTEAEHFLAHLLLISRSVRQDGFMAEYM
jgi:hypothetical protein